MTYRMKRNQTVSALLLVALGLLQGSAMADPGRGHNGRCGRDKPACEGEQGPGHQRRDAPGQDRLEHERGAGPAHAYYRGDRLPHDYRARQYVVDDWRGHGLRSPPRGYHWVQTGGDYVLVAIATGVILELLLGR
jgi:Ni/Co efflux regulator RcnB